MTSSQPVEQRCPRCNGVGYFESPSLWHSDVRDCGECHGTGRVPAPPAPVEPCVTCGLASYAGCRCPGDYGLHEPHDCPTVDAHPFLAPAPQQVEDDEHADGTHCFGFESCAHLSHFVAGEDVTAEFEARASQTPPLIEGDRDKWEALSDYVAVNINPDDAEDRDFVAHDSIALAFLAGWEARAPAPIEKVGEER